MWRKQTSNHCQDHVSQIGLVGKLIIVFVQQVHQIYFWLGYHTVLFGAGDSSTSSQKLNIHSPHSSMFASVSNCVINVDVTSSSTSV
jgi:hypothetical protein